MKSVAIVGAVLTALAVQYAVLIRPWYQTWGASIDEMRRTLPGDELWPAARRIDTRAITIRAPAEEVWPWVAQLGQQRGGFYSYRVLENLLGFDMPEADHLLGLPDPRPGERMWIASPARWGGAAYATYARVDPGRALVVETHELSRTRADATAPASGTWAFVLVPLPDRTTRLLVRARSGDAAAPPSIGATLAAAVVYEPIGFVMERKMMLGLRDRAEGRRPPAPWVDVTYVVLWAVTALLAVASVIAIGLRRRAWWKPLAASTAALFVLTLLFFARPPLAIAVIAVAALRWALSWAWQKPGAGTPAMTGGAG